MLFFWRCASAGLSAAIFQNLRGFENLLGFERIFASIPNAVKSIYVIFVAMLRMELLVLIRHFIPEAHWASSS
jgi:ethanolamine transporter EutH